MIKLGVMTPAAHMFAFYFAILRRSRRRWRSRCSPRRASPRPTCGTPGWAAMRIGAAGYIVPFMFAAMACAAAPLSGWFLEAMKGHGR